MATKAELIEQATGLGLVVDDGMTNAAIQEAIDAAWLAPEPTPFVAPENPEGVIPPGYDIDAEGVAAYVCPVCHERGEPDTYAEHAAGHAALLTACIDAKAAVAAQAEDLGVSEPDVERAMALISEPTIAAALTPAPVE